MPASSKERQREPVSVRVEVQLPCDDAPVRRRNDPHRLTLRIPIADEDSKRWWDLQDDPSMSTRMLIRDEIRRNGFTDVATRPVTHSPRVIVVDRDNGRVFETTPDSLDMNDPLEQRAAEMALSFPFSS